MIFAQNIPYVRQHMSFTMADREGSVVAHHDLVDAVVQYSAVIDGISFFLDGYNDASRKTTEIAIAELRGDSPHTAIAMESVHNMDWLTSKRPHIFFTADSGFLPLSQSRLAFGRHAYPICMLVHAIDSPTMLSLYSAAITCGLPYDAIVVTSRAGAETVQQLQDEVCQFLGMRLGAKTPPGLRVVRIPLGVDTEFIQIRDKAMCRSILGLPQDRTILLYLGRLTEEQKADMDPLLLAFRQILEENRQVHLVIAGSDPIRAYAPLVERTVKALGLDGHVSFMLNFPHFSKPLIYSACDIFVSPADNIQETFGLVLVEALAAGLPIVASDWSGYRDIVSKENGFTIPTLWDSTIAATVSPVAALCGFSGTRHALAQRTVLDTGALYRSLKVLVDSPELRGTFGVASRTRALQEFAWPKIIEKYDQLWREQQNQLDCEKARGGVPAFCLDYEKLFRHFATDVLRPELVLRVNSRNAHAVIRPENLRVKLPLSVRPEQISMVMDYVGKRELFTIRELMAGPGAGSPAAIYWLLKKGVLEISSESALTNRSMTA